MRRHHGGLPGVLRKEPGEREKASIRKELEQAKQQSKAQHRQREKVKTKTGVWNYDG